MVQTQHKNFQAYYSKWTKMRDVFAGDEQMKKNSARYIPPLNGQKATDDSYKEVIQREVFENYTKATGKGIAGLIFAKNPLLEPTPKVKAIQENIDLAGNNIIDLAQMVVNEVVEVGRCGLLIDMLNIDTAGLTVADTEKLNIRPYVKLYQAENIINWDYQLINNKTELSLLVLQEIYRVPINTYDRVDRYRYRVYTIEDGICVVRIFEGTDNNTFNMVSETIPKMNGKALDFIPFVCLNDKNLNIEPSNPPLLDIANINISHWYLSVERRNALHFVGFPSVYGVNLQIPKGSSVNLGAGTINTFDSPNAKLEYLQLSADGLGSVEKALEEKKQAMLALGARLLAPDSASQISENTMQMKTAGQRAVIIQIAETISRGITRALDYLSMWLGETPNNVFSLNTDYNLSEINPQLMTAMFTGNQIGLLPLEDIYNNLKKGEMTEFETFEEWKTALETQSPISTNIPTLGARSGRTTTATN